MKKYFKNSYHSSLVYAFNESIHSSTFLLSLDFFLLTYLENVLISHALYSVIFLVSDNNQYLTLEVRESQMKANWICWINFISSVEYTHKHLHTHTSSSISTNPTDVNVWKYLKFHIPSIQASLAPANVST